MTRPRSLAAVQTVPVPGDVETNLEQHVDLALLAAAAGARVAVFPELSLTGYELERARELALTEDDPTLRPLGEVARSRGLTLVVGAPLRVGEALYIGAFILAPDRPVEVYTKHHLGAFPQHVNPGGRVPPAEATVFEPGDRNPLVLVGSHRAAVAICADIARPSHAESAARRGAGTYLASSFVIPSDLEGDTARLQGYAESHSMAVVFSNFGGPSGGLPSGGHSAIWSPRGQRLARLGGRGAGVAVALEEKDGWRTEAVMLDGPDSA